MKKIFYACLLFSLFACNNQNTDSKEKGSKPVAVSEMISSTAGCGSLILFHKGAIIEGATYDGAGKQTGKQTTTVTDVKEEGGILVASSSAVTNGPTGERRMNMVYKCDGKNLFMDMNSVLQNFDVLKNIKGDIKPIRFPIDISVGQTLPDASYTVAVDRGEVKMDITTSYANRRVAAMEKITTTAGSWDCYKVSSDIVSDVKGLDEKMKAVMDKLKDKLKMSTIMWYTPKIGIVKTEMYRDGKLFSRSEITGIKE